MHPFVHRRTPAERPQRRITEIVFPDVDELPARPLPPFALRDLRDEVLEAFREARRGKT